MNVRVNHKTNTPFFHRLLKNPARIITLSFVGMIITGTLLLMLPIATKMPQGISFSAALFTATSACCVTGLTIFDTFTAFTLFGQIVILALIQFGGLGLVTFATLFNVAVRKKLGLTSAHLAQESVLSDNLGDIKSIFYMIFKVTFALEFIATAVLSTVFVPEFGLRGIYVALFTSVSAYCNAGFDVLGFVRTDSSMMIFNNNPVVLITLMLLIIVGGLGFVVYYDLACYKKRKRLLLHTKIVLIMSGLLIVLGAVLFMFTEWHNPSTLGNMKTWQKILNSFFISVSCRSAGFAPFDASNLNGSTKLISVVLMFIGVAPGSTGGGVKLTTIAVLIMTVVCVIRGKSDTIILGRRVDKQTIYKSISVVVISFAIVLFAFCAINFTVHENYMATEIDALYEAVSAFGNVGLSVGVSRYANLITRLALTLTMFFGRVGPISIILSISQHSSGEKHQVIPDGKVIVA